MDSHRRPRRQETWDERGKPPNSSSSSLGALEAVKSDTLNDLIASQFHIVILQEAEGPLLPGRMATFSVAGAVIIRTRMLSDSQQILRVYAIATGQHELTIPDLAGAREVGELALRWKALFIQACSQGSSSLTDMRRHRHP